MESDNKETSVFKAIAYFLRIILSLLMMCLGVYIMYNYYKLTMN